MICKRAHTLPIAAQALVYSVSEYCALVWERSSHTDKIDIQLNETIKIIGIGYNEILCSAMATFPIKYCPSQPWT